MKLGGCTREKEVAESLERGHWPDACTAELRAHVAGCRVCGDLILVTQAFRRARADAADAARLAPAGGLWWRAQLRRRNTAIQRIGRPILGAQIFALAVSLLVAGGLLVSQGLHWMSWLEALPQSLHLEALWPSTLPNFAGGLSLLVPVLATVALLSGVVVYLASEKQ
jgi:hypothetical protein